MENTSRHYISALLFVRDTFVNNVRIWDVVGKKIGARETKWKWNMIIYKLTTNKHESFFFFGWCFCDVILGRTLSKWPRAEWTAGPMGETEHLMKKDVILVCLISFCMPLWPSSCGAMTVYIFIFQSLTLPFAPRRSHNSLHKKFCTWWSTSHNTSLFFSVAISPFSSPSASPTTHAHSVLSKALVRLLTPKILQSNSTSSIHLNQDLPLFLFPLVCLPLISLLSLHPPFLQHGQATTVYIL